MQTGIFIAIEGGEGSGKTTLIRGLEKALDEQGIPHLSTREPGGTEAGKRIREILLDPAQSLSPLAELMLFAADRADHVATVIKPALEQGLVVLCDRFSGSTVAYQGFGRGMDFDHIKRLDEMARQGVRPTLTLWLDVDPSVAMNRLNRSHDRMESQGTEFHRKVHEGFLTQYLFHKTTFTNELKHGQWVRIDASQDPETVAKEAYQWIRMLWIRSHAVDPEHTKNRPNKEAVKVL